MSMESFDRKGFGNKRIVLELLSEAHCTFYV